MEPRPYPIVRIINKVVETTAVSMTPKARREGLQDLMETHPPAYAYHVADFTVRAIVDAAECALYPAITINRGSFPPQEKRKRLNDLPPILWNTLTLWICAY